MVKFNGVVVPIGAVDFARLFEELAILCDMLTGGRVI